jgi:hypothetical protein
MSIRLILLMAWKIHVEVEVDLWQDHLEGFQLHRGRFT